MGKELLPAGSQITPKKLKTKIPNKGRGLVAPGYAETQPSSLLISCLCHLHILPCRITTQDKSKLLIKL